MGLATALGTGCVDTGSSDARVGIVECKGATTRPAEDGRLPPSSQDWPTTQFDARHTGHNPAVTDAPRSCARVVWQFRTAGYEAREQPAETVLLGGPSVRDGTVYIGTRSAAYALDVQHGRQHWRRELRAPGTATPTVGPDQVFVGGDGALQALDRDTGRARWHATIPAPYADSRTDDWIEAAPALGDEAVFVGTTGGRLMAFDRTSGDRLWTVTAPLADPTEPRGPDNTNRFGGAPAVSDGVVYAGNWNGRLTAHDAATGDQLWATETGGRIESSPTVVGETLFVTTGTDVWAVDIADGSERWRYREDPGSAIESPAVADGTLYAGVGPAFESLSLVALDLDDRTVAWRAPGRPQAAASVASGAVYVGIGRGLTAFDATSGETAWRLRLESVLDEAPVVVHGGVIVADRAGRVYGVGRE